MDEQKDALKRQIQTQIELLSTMEEGSEEKLRETKVLDDLYRLAIDQAKMDADFKAAKTDREVSAADRQHRIMMDYVRTGIEVVAGVTTFVGTIAMFNTIMKFEETGTFNSKASQMLLRCMHPFKK